MATGSGAAAEPADAADAANEQALFGHAEVAELGPDGELQPPLAKWIPPVDYDHYNTKVWEPRSKYVGLPPERVEAVRDAFLAFDEEEYSEEGSGWISLHNLPVS